MATSQRNLKCDKEQSLRLTPGGNEQGNGHDDHAPVGMWNGYRHRDLVRFAMNWAGVRRIRRALLILTSSRTTHVSFGASPRIDVQRLKEGFSEGGGSEDNWTKSAKTDYPGPPVTGAAYTSNNFSRAQLREYHFDITSHLNALAPETVLKSDGVSPGAGGDNFGFVIRAATETSENDTWEYYSRRTSRPPRIELEYDDSLPPTSPTELTPGATDSAAPEVLQAGTRVTIAGRFNDPDLLDQPPATTTDYCSAVEVEFWDHDDAATNIATRRGWIDPQKSGVNGGKLAGTSTRFFSVVIDTWLRPPVHNANLKYRVRTYDRRGMASSWSNDTVTDSNAQGWLYIRPNTKPTVTNLWIDTYSLTPVISGVMIDADRGYATNNGQAGIGEPTIGDVRVIVEFVDPRTGSITTKWDAWTGTAGGDRFELTYGGNALGFNTAYRMNIQIKDNYGGLSPDPTTGEAGAPAWVTFTPIQLVGPSNMRPRTVAASPAGGKQLTRTPNLIIGHANQYDAYNIVVFSDSEGDTEIWRTGADDGGQAGTPALVGSSWDLTRAYGNNAGYTGNQFTVALPLSWGQTAYWKAQVRAAGVWTPYSTIVPFYIDQQPSAPSLSWYRASDQRLIPLSTTATTAVDSMTPVFSAPFIDPDEAAYGDHPIAWQRQVLRDTGAVVSVISSLVEGEDEPALWSPARILNFDFAKNWAADTNHTLTPDAVRVEGSASLKTAVAAQPLSTLRVDRFNGLAPNGVYTNLSSADWTTMHIQRRIDGTIANLANWSIRFIFSGNEANQATFFLANQSTPTGVWSSITLTRATPTSTAGTVNWAQVSGVQSVWSTGAGGTLTCTGYLDDLAINTLLAAAVTYRIAVRYGDDNTEGVYGAWSANGQPIRFRCSSPPVVTAGAAVNVIDPTPILDYTFTSALPQAQQRIRVYLNSDSTLVYDSGWVPTAVTDHKVPEGYLENTTAYRWTVDAMDTEFLVGTYASAAWTTAFVLPSPIHHSIDVLAAATAIGATALTVADITDMYVGDPIMVGTETSVITALTPTTGITVSPALTAAHLIGEKVETGTIVETNPATSAVEVTFLPSAVAPTTFEEYRIYRSDDGGTPTLVGTVETQTQTDTEGVVLPFVTFVDWSAPIGMSLAYTVTVWTGGLESLPGSTAMVFSDLPDKWWLVVPGNESLSFPISVVRPPFTVADEKPQTVHRIMGRRYPIVTEGVTQAPVGEVQIEIHYSAYETVARVKAVAAASMLLEYVVLKTGIKRTFRCRMGTIKESYGTAGTATLSFQITTVA